MIDNFNKENEYPSWVIDDEEIDQEIVELVRSNSEEIKEPEMDYDTDDLEEPEREYYTIFVKNKYAQSALEHLIKVISSEIDDKINVFANYLPTYYNSSFVEAEELENMFDELEGVNKKIDELKETLNEWRERMPF